MNQTLEAHSESDEEPQSTDLQLTFQQFLSLFAEKNIFNGSRRGSGSTEPKERLVTRKMRSKLLGWLEKLSLTTFKFHRITFITAILILDQYLHSTDQSPPNLQLAGCACLLIASKLRESVIVALECYVTACCNIYSKKQLLQKQRAIYSQVSFIKIKEGVLGGVQRACLVLQMQQDIDRTLEVLAEMMKKEGFLEWNEERVVCAVLSLVKVGHERKVSNNDTQSMETLL